MKDRQEGLLALLVVSLLANPVLAQTSESLEKDAKTAFDEIKKKFQDTDRRLTSLENLVTIGGLSRQVAYAIVQRNAMQSWREHKPFIDLLLADAEVTDRVAEDELRGLFDYNYYLTNIGATFERLGL